ncbi:MAG: recombinase family protein [Steroidobacteraceae bacterium]
MQIRCYSYARFSSEKQKHGASLQRQLEAAVKYAQSHSLILDPSTYRDLGVSAFRSKNVDGALGAFIEAVDAKRIPKGSYLLVESLDRLSRDSVDVALKLFLDITGKGIVLVTLMDEQVYSKATINENWTKLIMALAIMARANEESVTKSKRAKDAIQRRSSRGEIPTTRLPTWMKFNVDRKSAVLIPQRSKVVKRIFHEVIEGTGAREIARDLNKQKVPVLFYATEWRQSAISQLLKNPAVYGEFKGKEGVLPAVLTKARFLRAQRIIRDRTLYKGGFSRSNPNNTFVGLGRCGHCGRVMRFLPRTDGSFYLRCVGATDNGTCNGRLFPFVPCEMALVIHLTLMETNQGLTQAIYTEKYEQAQVIDNEISIVKSKQERLLKIAEISGDVEALGLQLRKLQDDLTRLQNEHKEIGISISDSEDSTTLFSDYSALVNKRSDHKSESGADILELRKKLKMAFVRVLKKVEFMNANEKKWKPTLRLTYVNDRTAAVDVSPWLSERTKKWIENGTFHRADLGKKKR